MDSIKFHVHGICLNKMFRLNRDKSSVRHSGLWTASKCLSHELLYELKTNFRAAVTFKE